MTDVIKRALVRSCRADDVRQQRCLSRAPRGISKLTNHYYRHCTRAQLVHFILYIYITYARAMYIAIMPAMQMKVSSMHTHLKVARPESRAEYFSSLVCLDTQREVTRRSMPT